MSLSEKLMFEPAVKIFALHLQMPRK